MTITEFSELNLQLQKVEETLIQCQEEIFKIKEQMKQIGGELKPRNEQCSSLENPFSGHTPYFDMLDENDLKTEK